MSLVGILLTGTETNRAGCLGQPTRTCTSMLPRVARLNLLWMSRARSQVVDALGLGGFDACLLPLPDELALHLGHHAQHGHKDRSCHILGRERGVEDGEGGRLVASLAVRHEQVRECLNHVVALSFEIVSVKVPADARIVKSLDPYRFFFQLVLAKLHEPPAVLNSQVPSSLV
jgi:hypothetical protein